MRAGFVCFERMAGAGEGIAIKSYLVFVVSTMKRSTEGLKTYSIRLFGVSPSFLHLADQG